MESATGARGRKTAWFVALLLIGLACMDIWPDMMGHCSALVPANDSFAELGMNGRFFWSCGLCVTCFAIAAYPAQVKRLDVVLSFVAPLVGIACSIGYAFVALNAASSSALIAGAFVLGTALCYSWLEVRLVSLVGRALAFSTVVAALAASRVIKLTFVAFFGAAPEILQIAGMCSMPLITGACAICAAKLADDAQSANPVAVRGMADVPFSRSSALSDTVTATVFLVACSVLSAVARSMSDLGYWGEQYVIGSDYLFYILPVGVALSAVVYLMFFRVKESEMLSHLVVLFLVVLAGFYLQNPYFVTTLGLPSIVSAQASVATELFSQFLFWVSMIAAMRLGGVAPYRAVGLGEGCMSATAIVLGIAFMGSSDFQGPLAAASTYAILAVTWYLMHRMQKKSDVREDAAQVDPVEASCDDIATRSGLTPREAEVLRLLARGRSRSFIQSELFLSDGTVKTHIRHIYQKTGVHSKQELISLVEEHSV